MTRAEQAVIDAARKWAREADRMCKSDFGNVGERRLALIEASEALEQAIRLLEESERKDQK